MIEQVRSGSSELFAGSGAATLDLGVEKRDLEIDHTALSIPAPPDMDVWN